MFNMNLIEKIKVIVNFVGNKEKRKAGLFSEGKNALYVNCKGRGPDAGMIDKGKGTKIINGEFEATDRN